MESDEPEKRRVITTKNVLDILRPNSEKSSTKSVLTPSAQITSLCDGTDQLGSTIRAFETCRQQLKLESKELYYLFLIQFENALRISEVLSIKAQAIDKFGNVSINGSKGSKGKLIGTGEAREFMIYCRDLKISPFAHYNRFYIYRLYKKYNLVMLMPNRKKFSVTHSARHLSAMAAREANFNESVLSSHLSHKSLNSTNHYGK